MRHCLTFQSSPQENTDASWVKDNRRSWSSLWFNGTVTLLIVTSIKNILITAWLMCYVAIDFTFIFSMLTFCLPLGFPEDVHLQRMCTTCCLLPTSVIEMCCFPVKKQERPVRFVKEMTSRNKKCWGQIWLAHHNMILCCIQYYHKKGHKDWEYWDKKKWNLTSYICKIGIL